MMQSIMQDKKECYFTSRTDNLHKHHIFFGTGNRKVSEDNGFWIWITGEWHNQDSRKDIHSNMQLDLRVRMQCQRKYEETHSRQEFRKLIGESYL